MAQIEKGRLPMHIMEIYLFGSFLKKKERPTDIDILLIYDPNRTAEMYEYVDRKGRGAWRMWDLRTSPARLRGMLKFNAERSVDINICPSLKAFQTDLEYDMDVWLKIWRTDDRDWKSKLIDYFTSQTA